MAGCIICGKKYIVFCAYLLLLLQLSSAEYNEKLENLIAKISAGVSYYEKNYKSISIDGLFGVRIIEGELMFLISQSEYAFDNSAKLPIGLVKKLKVIQERARIVSENTLPFIQALHSDYYKKVGFLVETAWRPTVYYRKISPSSRWPPGKPLKVLTEKTGDLCIKELHDSIGQVENDAHTSCKFSNRCLEYMIMSKHTFGYGLVHQVLYLQIAQKLGCLTSLNNLLIRNSTNAYQLTSEFCANIHEEVTRTAEKTDNFRHLVDDFNADLFCEQVFMCSNVGFMEFANVSYLDQILSWQMPSGCFKEPETVKTGKRRLQYSQNFKDGCSTHMTAVALGALSAYLRLFLDFNIQMYFSDFPSYPRLIIEERNEIQRKNLPHLIDERDALEREKRRSKVEEKFKPLWPSPRQHVQSVVKNVQRDIEESLETQTVKEDSSFSSFIKNVFNWMFMLSVIMVIYVLFRKGYLLRLIAFIYRRRQSVFHNV